MENQAMTKIGTVFSELIKLVPRFYFNQAVTGYNGDRYTKSFTTWRQFITILYSQITHKDSLREIETGLLTQSCRWYYLGLSTCKTLISSFTETGCGCRKISFHSNAFKIHKGFNNRQRLYLNYFKT